MNGLVSVIIPCYRQAAFLADCVRSLQAQTHTSWEAIIVDDGSPDDTQTVALQLSKLERRVRYHRKANGGLSSARNAGIRVAGGEYLQFLDADDLLSADKLRSQLRILEAKPDVGIVYGNAWYFRSGETANRLRGPYAESPDHDWIDEAWNEPRPLLEKLCDRNLFPVCSALVRKAVVDRVGLFNEALQALEDWEFWLRCAAADIRFEYLPAPDSESLVRLHDGSMSNDTQRMDRAGFEMRLSCLPHLRSGSARRLTFARLLTANSRLPSADRRQRYRAIRAARLDWRERSLLTASSLVDPHGVLHPIASRLNRYLPRGVRNYLAALGLSLAE